MYTQQEQTYRTQKWRRILLLNLIGEEGQVSFHFQAWLNWRFAKILAGCL